MRRVLRAETRAHGRRVEVTQVQVAEPVNRDAATRAVTTPPRGPRHSTGSPPAMVTLKLGMAHGFVGVLMVCRHESTRCQEGVVWRSDEGLRVFQGRAPKEDSPAACTCARSSCSHSARRQLRGLAGRGRSAIANFETDSQVSQISGSGVEGKNTGRLNEVLSNFKGEGRGGVIQSPEFRSSGVRT